MFETTPERVREIARSLWPSTAAETDDEPERPTIKRTARGRYRKSKTGDPRADRREPTE